MQGVVTMCIKTAGVIPNNLSHLYGVHSNLADRSQVSQRHLNYWMPMCGLKNAFVLAAIRLLNNVFYVLYYSLFIAFCFMVVWLILDPKTFKNPNISCSSLQISHYAKIHQVMQIGPFSRGVIAKCQELTNSTNSSSLFPYRLVSSLVAYKIKVFCVKLNDDCIHYYFLR